MIKILYIIFLSLIVTNCSFKKVSKHHGVPFLEKKQSSLIVNKTNKNDIRAILGYPSTTSKFDNDVWIYIERKQTPSRTGMRRAQTMKYSTKNIVEDKKSGEYRLSHHLDLKTGMYKGRQVLDPKE